MMLGWVSVLSNCGHEAPWWIAVAEIQLSTMEKLRCCGAMAAAMNLHGGMAEIAVFYIENLQILVWVFFTDQETSPKELKL